MGKFDGLLLVSDLDGTLLNAQHRLSASTIEAVRYFQSEGGRFTLATGRRPVSMRQFLGPITLNAPSICYNGACICSADGHQVLYETHLTGTPQAIVAAALRDLPYAGITVYQGDELQCIRANAIAEGLIAHELGTMRLVDYSSIPLPWTKIIFTQEIVETAQIKSYFATSPFFDHYQFVQSAAHYYEVLPAGTSKGQALKQLCAMIGQDIRQTIAVGDNENDIEMLQMAGLGIAVDNASENVKRHADCTTIHHDRDAIVQVIADIAAGRFLLQVTID